MRTNVVVFWNILRIEDIAGGESESNIVSIVRFEIVNRASVRILSEWPSGGPNIHPSQSYSTSVYVFSPINMSVMFIPFGFILLLFSNALVTAQRTFRGPCSVILDKMRFSGYLVRDCTYVDPFVYWRIEHRMTWEGARQACRQVIRLNKYGSSQF